jgi:7,8-dihydropterin-6-yl-methyl-4-(beta-D-ribofuranosyl)aminobenzene 5'-phosphate synthase
MVKGLTLTVLIEDSASVKKPNLLAQHGLSILLNIDLTDSERLNVLMDTGPSPDTTLHNIDALNIDPKTFDVIFLSHGHYDHTGGIIGILRRIGKKVPLIAHPSIFEPKLKVEPYLKYIGLPFTPSTVEVAGGIILCAKSNIDLAKGVMTSGQVERSTTFEKTEGFHTIKEGQFIKDNLPDDQALIIDVEDKGLVIVSGCAHSGIVNMIEHAQKMTNIKDIYAIMGGLHLEKADDERIKLTIEELLKLDSKVVAPCHCTGPKAVNRLTEAFGSRCFPLRTGDTLRL